MKLFLKKFLGFFLICFGPFVVILLGGYFYYDPFKVLRPFNEKDYSYATLPFVPKNRDYMSTELFLKNYPKYHYNSFIFGSSRSLSTQPSSWKKYLGPDDHPFAFDAAGESLYGMYRKILFLDERQVPIKNAIITICRDWSFKHEGNHDGHMFVKHPLISGESRLAFQLKFLDAYFDKDFLKSYYTYEFTHQYRPWMMSVLWNITVANDPATNEVRMVSTDSMIQSDPIGFYATRKNIFYTRNEERVDPESRINDKFHFMLSEIKRILVKHKTNYKIVCSPLYDEVKFSPHDKKILTDIFGDHLYDLTGKSHLTEKVSNYYEPDHYRPLVGDSILSIIYRK